MPLMTAMLCRTANELYWMARHIERAENTARLLDVTYRTSLLPYEPQEPGLAWAEPWAVPLISTGWATGFYEHYPQLTAANTFGGGSTVTGTTSASNVNFTGGGNLTVPAGTSMNPRASAVCEITGNRPLYRFMFASAKAHSSASSAIRLSVGR